MQTTAIAPLFFKTHCRVTKVVDGDGIFVQDIFSKDEFEIRLLGIDAPETKRCKKLMQDERETHLPGQLLMQLGITSKQFLASFICYGDKVSLITESNSYFDPYGRVLAYVILSDGRCLSEVMIKEGYAKPYAKYFSSKLNYFQQLSFEAKQNKRGLYNEVNSF